MIIERWFDWIDKYPLWLQFVIAIPIGMVFMAIICGSIEGIKRINEWWAKNITEGK